LFGIPFGLYSPFISVYMAALMLSDRQIGLVASISLLFRAAASLLSGAVTDKLGRRLATGIFDLCSWSIPCLLWAFSQNFWWFAAAAAINGLYQIPDTSWNCLLVEDADKDTLVTIYSLIHLAVQLSIIFAPLAAVLVGRLTIVPAMRIIYLFTFLSMSAKFILLYIFSTETEVGVTRKRETAGMSIWKIMSGYGRIMKQILSSPDMVLALSLATIFGIMGMIMGNFFGLYVTGRLLIPEHFLAYFPILRSLIIVVFFFVFQPKLERFGFRYPMLLGLLFFIAGFLVLLYAPANTLSVIFIYIILEACGYSLVLPRSDSLTALLIEPSERARIRGLMTVIVLGCSIPFGYLAGWLSDMDRRLPFVLISVFCVLVFIIIAASKKRLDRLRKQEP